MAGFSGGISGSGSMIPAMPRRQTPPVAPQAPVAPVGMGQQGGGMGMPRPQNKPQNKVASGPGEIRQTDWETMSKRKVGDTMPNGYTITDRQEFATGSPQLAAALARIRAGGTL